MVVFCRTFLMALPNKGCFRCVSMLALGCSSTPISAYIGTGSTITESLLEIANMGHAVRHGSPVSQVKFATVDGADVGAGEEQAATASDHDEIIDFGRFGRKDDFPQGFQKWHCGSPNVNENLPTGRESELTVLHGIDAARMRAVGTDQYIQIFECYCDIVDGSIL